MQLSISETKNSRYMDGALNNVEIALSNSLPSVGRCWHVWSPAEIASGSCVIFAIDGYVQAAVRLANADSTH